MNTDIGAHDWQAYPANTPIEKWGHVHGDAHAAEALHRPNPPLPIIGRSPRNSNTAAANCLFLDNDRTGTGGRQTEFRHPQPDRTRTEFNKGRRTQAAARQVDADQLRLDRADCWPNDDTSQAWADWDPAVNAATVADLDEKATWHASQRRFDQTRLPNIQKNQVDVLRRLADERRPKPKIPPPPPVPVVPLLPPPEVPLRLPRPVPLSVTVVEANQYSGRYYKPPPAGRQRHFADNSHTSESNTVTAGKTYLVPADHNYRFTAARLKELIHDNTGVPPHNQRLTLAGRMLQDNATLDDGDARHHGGQRPDGEHWPRYPAAHHHSAGVSNGDYGGPPPRHVIHMTEVMAEEEYGHVNTRGERLAESCFAAYPRGYLRQLDAQKALSVRGTTEVDTALVNWKDFILSRRFDFLAAEGRAAGSAKMVINTVQHLELKVGVGTSGIAGSKRPGQVSSSSPPPPPPANAPSVKHSAYDGAVSETKLKAVFDSVDANHDGSLSAAEVIKALRKGNTIAVLMGLIPDVESALAQSQDGEALPLIEPIFVRQESEVRRRFQEAFNSMDSDGGKTISFDEFRSWFENERRSQQSDVDGALRLQNITSHPSSSSKRQCPPMHTAGDLDTVAASTSGNPLGEKPASQSEMNSSGVSDLSKVFNQFDTDGSGALSLSELKRALQAIGIKKVDFEKVFESFDRNGDGRVTLEEFDANLDSRTRSLLKDNLNKEGVMQGWRPLVDVAKVFAQIDTDGSGSLTKAELKYALTCVGFFKRDGALSVYHSQSTTCSHNTAVDEVYSAFDTDGDGLVSLEEFRNGLTTTALEYLTKHLNHNGLLSELKDNDNGGRDRREATEQSVPLLHADFDIIFDMLCKEGGGGTVLTAAMIERISKQVNATGVLLMDKGLVHSGGVHRTGGQPRDVDCMLSIAVHDGTGVVDRQAFRRLAISCLPTDDLLAGFADFAPRPCDDLDKEEGARGAGALNGAWPDKAQGSLTGVPNTARGTGLHQLLPHRPVDSRHKESAEFGAMTTRLSYHNNESVRGKRLWERADERRKENAKDKVQAMGQAAMAMALHLDTASSQLKAGLDPQLVKVGHRARGDVTLCSMVSSEISIGSPLGRSLLKKKERGQILTTKEKHAVRESYLERVKHAEAQKAANEAMAERRSAEHKKNGGKSFDSQGNEQHHKHSTSSEKHRKHHKQHHGRKHLDQAGTGLPDPSTLPPLDNMHVLVAEEFESGSPLGKMLHKKLKRGVVLSKSEKEAVRSAHLIRMAPKEAGFFRNVKSGADTKYGDIWLAWRNARTTQMTI